MSRIFLDTNFFIYLIEGSGPRTTRAMYLLKAFANRRDEILTSVMTLGEVLVAPLRNGDLAMAERYRTIFRGPGVSVQPFLEDGAELFARIRIKGSIRPPDAIQLAIAGNAKCDLFLTNDSRLAGITVPGIQFITSFDNAPI